MRTSYKENLTNLKNEIRQAIQDYPNQSPKNNRIKHGSSIIRFSKLMDNLKHASDLYEDELELLSILKSYMCDLNKLNKKSLHDEVNHNSVTSELTSDAVMRILGGDEEEDEELDTEAVLKEFAGGFSDSEKLYVNVRHIDDAVKNSLKRVNGKKFKVLFDSTKPEIIKEFVQYTSKFVSISHADFMKIKYKFVPTNVTPELFDRFIKRSDFSGSNFGYILVVSD